jgi:hypothetical protein
MWPRFGSRAKEGIPTFHRVPAPAAGGIPDEWKRNGVTIDPGSGNPPQFVDLPKMGVTLDRPNVLVQLDWMEDDTPRNQRLRQAAIDTVINAFDQDPVTHAGRHGPVSPSSSMPARTVRSPPEARPGVRSRGRSRSPGHRISSPPPLTAGIRRSKGSRPACRARRPLAAEDTPCPRPRTDPIIVAPSRDVVSPMGDITVHRARQRDVSGRCVDRRSPRRPIGEDRDNSPLRAWTRLVGSTGRRTPLPGRRCGW